jgi:hypothetical protein
MNRRVLVLIAVAAVLVVGVSLVRKGGQTVPVGGAKIASDGGISPSAETPGIPPPPAPLAAPQAPTSARADVAPPSVAGTPVPAMRADSQNPLPPTAVGTNSSGVFRPPTAGPMAAQPLAPSAAAPAISTEGVAIELDKVNLSLRDYRTIMGENPIGTNSEIVQALNGGNPKKARLLQEGLTQNGNGELVDRWGTPYFFHQLSKDQTQIRSGGPDRTMWTDDDIISN